MKVTNFNLHNTKKMILSTDTIEKMNDFILNDGSDYNLIGIDTFEYKNKLDIRMTFEHGLLLFMTIEK